MATSRRLLFTSSFLGIRRTAPAYTTSSFSQSLLKPLALSSHQSLLFTKSSLCSPKPHLFRRYNCSSASAAAAIDVETTTTIAPASHPWPEWVSFLDNLKKQGYFNESSATSMSEVNEDDDGGDDSVDTTYKDVNELKTACLNFARNRIDILKSLSREDIQTVVGRGCPNLFRKAVNSAKRLRAFVKLDEGDVCASCNLRGSCDRAYALLKEHGLDTAARTVDIVRLLLTYALDPLFVSGGEKLHGREQVEVAVRKLLLEVIELSEKAPDPALPKPAIKPVIRKEQSEKVRDRQPSQGIEMKRGDWSCPKCNFMNFARNIKCRECGKEGPKIVSLDIEMKKGDWNCPECQYMNFARNIRCVRCKVSRPKRVLNPGEWECPSCDFLNYRRNMACKKCDCERPKDEVAQYEDRIWRRPS